MSADTPQARIVEAWEGGNLVIIATVAEGPLAGQAIACIAPRDVMLHHLNLAPAAMAKGQDVVASITSAIRAALYAPGSHLAPGQDGDLMDDLALLMVCKLAGGGEAVLAGSGLFSLLLQVDRDTSKPWHQRGFISAEAARLAVPMEIG